VTWWLLALRMLFGISLAVIAGGSALFSYISFKVRALKYGGGLLAVTVVSVFIFYWLILLDPLSVVSIGP